MVRLSLYGLRLDLAGKTTVMSMHYHANAALYLAMGVCTGNMIPAFSYHVTISKWIFE
jgi:hypothetical protein